MVVETQRITAKGNDEEEEKKFMNLLRKPRIVRSEIYWFVKSGCMHMGQAEEQQK